MLSLLFIVNSTTKNPLEKIQFNISTIAHLTTQLNSKTGKALIDIKELKLKLLELLTMYQEAAAAYTPKKKNKSKTR